MKELTRYTDNLTAIDNALRTSGNDGILAHMAVPVGEFLKMLAVSGVDLSAKCIRPVVENQDADS